MSNFSESSIATGQAPRTQEPGHEMFQLIERLYPICRSLTGAGVRQTLDVLQEHIALVVQSVPSNTEVFDWTVPKEWNIRDAYIKNSNGERIVDFNQSNLHVLGYSVPVDKRVSLAELKAHCFTLPDHPEWVPYRTSYYKEQWGFCLRHDQLQQLSEEDYYVSIDSTLGDGHLNYGECLLPGKTDAEVLISTHI